MDSLKSNTEMYVTNPHLALSLAKFIWPEKEIYSKNLKLPYLLKKIYIKSEKNFLKNLDLYKKLNLNKKKNSSIWHNLTSTNFFGSNHTKPIEENFKVEYDSLNLFKEYLQKNQTNSTILSSEDFFDD